MSDKQTETFKRGRQRFGDALMGVLIGLVLFVVSILLLVWNEGQAVSAAMAWEDGQKQVVSITPNLVDPANQDKLVHVTGLATTDEVLVDPNLGVTAKALQLERHVEMYQWMEKKEEIIRKKSDGGEETVRTYTYSKQWYGPMINSQNFGEPGEHQNPTHTAYPPWQWSAKKVTLGEFQLSVPVRAINASEALPIEPAALDRVDKANKARLTVSNGGFFLGDPTNPQIGDLRISYRVTLPTTVSLLAKQVGNSLEPFEQTIAGRRYTNRMQIGTHSAEEMFAATEGVNAQRTWLVRLIGYVFMAAGIGMVFKPLVVMADVVPFIGNLLGMGVAFVAGLLALPLTLTTIALGWIFYRPLLGIGLLAVAIAVIVGIVMLVRSRRRVPVGA